MTLDEVLRRIETLPPETLKELQAEKAKEGKRWLPNPGMQTEALLSEADELFFGGEPGGGKSQLLLGVAITEHTNSIIFRREFPQIRGLIKDAAAIIGTRNGYNHQDKLWRIPGTDKEMEFGSVPHEDDKEKYQGRAHDLKGFDEITHFSRTQYRYLTLWLRSTKPGQRCRIIATGNPPTQPEGFWVVEHWAPWLDPRYHDPAEPGELRWAVPANDDDDRELFFASLEEAMEHVATLANPPRDPDTGEIMPPRSRTFIPSKLAENWDLAKSGYGAVLGYADKSLRGLATGKFETALPDDPWQVIPTAWIIAAQERWTPQCPRDVPMTAIGVDVAQGGDDDTVLAPRHDWWFAELVCVPGVKTPMPSDTAALVVKNRRDGAAVIVDCGGGYGGGVVDWLQKNQIVAVPHKGGSGSGRRTKNRMHAFVNKRAEVMWRFREALDPEQPGGSPIALPNDAALRADLASARYEIGPRGIQVEDKAEIIKRIGRSPDRGDAVVMSWSEGQVALQRGLVGPTATMHREQPKFANVGYAAMKGRRR